MNELLCVVDQRRPYERAMVCQGCRTRLAVQLRDITDLYAVLPAALAQRPVTVVDLTLPARGGASAAAVHDPRRDQIGDIPVAAILDSWARDWLETLANATQSHAGGRNTSGPYPSVGQRLPAPTVPLLARWLSVRLTTACDRHPAIDEFAREIRSLLASMRRALNRDLSPVRYRAPCPYCATATLRRDPGAANARATLSKKDTA